MADFHLAFEKMIKNEGGFVLHTVTGDRGGTTYAGIAHNFHPNWPGWVALEKNPDNPAITEMVRDFYRSHYWQKIHGDDIAKQDIAGSIFDFAVNAGAKTSATLAQIVVGVTPDGIIGSQSILALNKADPALFISNFALAKITRYAKIVSRDRSQARFLLGWVNRTLEGLS